MRRQQPVFLIQTTVALTGFGLSNQLPSSDDDGAATSGAIIGGNSGVLWLGQPDVCPCAALGLSFWRPCFWFGGAGS